MKTTKDNMLHAQVMIISGLMEHVQDNLDDTVFEDQDTIETLVKTLTQGCNILVLQMEKFIKNDCCKDCCDCY
jgi:hypothetical protein